MTPPTALERCPTCDREGCAVAAAAALVASLTIPVTPGENGCACYGEFSRSHNPSRGCEIHGADGSVALEAAWSAERAAREDCHAHRVDWRARAIAAEARIATVAAEIEHDVGVKRSHDHGRATGGQTCGTGGPLTGAPQSMLRYLDRVVRDLHDKRTRAIADHAAQWAKVAPLIERLRAECGAAPFRGRIPSLIECAAAILAATEATP